MRNKIKRIINKLDPANLLHHAPDDEYDLEIERIIELLPTADNVNDLAKIIQDVFIEYMGTEFFKKDYNECLAIAKRLL